jgi:hypothetical protein
VTVRSGLAAEPCGAAPAGGCRSQPHQAAMTVPLVEAITNKGKRVVEAH